MPKTFRHDGDPISKQSIIYLQKTNLKKFGPLIQSFYKSFTKFYEQIKLLLALIPNLFRQ